MEVGVGQHHVFEVAVQQVGAAEAGAVEPGRPQRQLLEARLFEVRPGEVSPFDPGAGQVGPPQVGIDQESPREVGPGKLGEFRPYAREAGPAQVGIGRDPVMQVRLVKIGPAETGPIGVGLLEARPAQVGVSQFRAAQVDPREVLAGPDDPVEIGAREMRPAIRIGPPAGVHGVEQAGGQWLNAALVALDPPVQMPARRGVERDLPRDAAHQLARIVLGQHRLQPAARDEERDPVGGQQQGRGAVADEASQVLAAQVPTRPLRGHRGPLRCAGLAEHVDAEIFDPLPRDRQPVDPRRRLGTQAPCGTLRIDSSRAIRSSTIVQSSGMPSRKAKSPERPNRPITEAQASRSVASRYSIASSWSQGARR